MSKYDELGEALAKARDELRRKRLELSGVLLRLADVLREDWGIADDQRNEVLWFQPPDYQGDARVREHPQIALRQEPDGYRITMVVRIVEKGRERSPNADHLIVFALRLDDIGSQVYRLRLGTELPTLTLEMDRPDSLRAFADSVHGEVLRRLDVSGRAYDQSLKGELN